MSDLGDIFEDWRDQTRELKEKLGKDCPGCRIVQPRRIPTRMLPGQICRVCGYFDTRDPRIMKQSDFK